MPDTDYNKRYAYICQYITKLTIRLDAINAQIGSITSDRLATIAKIEGNGRVYVWFNRKRSDANSIRNHIRSLEAERARLLRNWTPSE